MKKIIVLFLVLTASACWGDELILDSTPFIADSRISFLPGNLIFGGSPDGEKIVIRTNGKSYQDLYDTLKPILTSPEAKRIFREHGMDVEVNRKGLAQ